MTVRFGIGKGMRDKGETEILTGLLSMAKGTGEIEKEKDRPSCLSLFFHSRPLRPETGHWSGWGRESLAGATIPCPSIPVQSYNLSLRLP